MTDEAMIERVRGAIEQAARQSTPWPDQWDWDDDAQDVVPSKLTLEAFVNNTYIGESGANEVFKAAAEAAARAAIEAMREPTDAMIDAANVMDDGHAVEYGDHKLAWQAMIDAALR